MNRLQRIAQNSLREKASILLDKPLKQISKVVEHESGATVFMKSGLMPWINIPLKYWIG